MGDPLAFGKRWFIGPDIHSSIHLAGIGSQNFSVEDFGNFNPDTAFPDCGWANYRDDGFLCANQFGMVHQ